MLLTTGTAQPSAVGPQCACSSCSRHITALSSQSSSKPCWGVRVPPLQCCFLCPCWESHCVVFGVLKGSTSGESCRWRNFCFVPCFHALSLSALNWWKQKNSVCLTECLKPNSTYSERKKCQTTLIPRQCWKHRITGLLCLAQTINICWAVHLHFCWLVVAFSVYCNMHSVVFITPISNCSDYPFLFKLLFNSVTYYLCLNCSSVCILPHSLQLQQVDMAVGFKQSFSYSENERK